MTRRVPPDLDARDGVPKALEGLRFGEGDASVQIATDFAEAVRFAEGFRPGTVRRGAIRNARELHGLSWGYIIGAKLLVIGSSYLVHGIAGLCEHRFGAASSSNPDGCLDCEEMRADPADGGR